MTFGLRSDQVMILFGLLGLCCGGVLVLRGIAGQPRRWPLRWMRIAGVSLLGVSFGVLITVLLSR